MLVLVCAALGCGCALVAKKVDTPAAELTGADLARLPASPDDRFFVLFFGSQDILRRPEFTHTSAALVRVSAARVGADGTATPGEIDPDLDVRMISWLPSKGTIDTKSRTVEPGRNYGLHETLKLAYDTGQSVAVWGPYEVWHGFAHRFAIQKEFLDTGAVGYQCIDSRGEAGRLGNGCDCIHAITDMDPLYPRWGYPLLYYGKPGTARAVRRFMHSPIWIHPRRTHDWLLPRLGLDAYPLERRRYIGVAEEHDPNSSADLETKALPLIPVGPRTSQGVKPVTEAIGKAPIEVIEAIKEN